MLTIRNREVAYPASRFVHVILDFSLWGNTKEHRVRKVKVNLTASNKSIKRSSCVKVDVLTSCVKLGLRRWFLNDL